MRYYLCAFLLVSSFLQADWIFEDDNGNRHVIQGDPPNPNPQIAIDGPWEEPEPFPFPPKPEDPDRIWNLCGKFYVSTDDPNVWIEVYDEDIGIEDTVFSEKSNKEIEETTV